jgi:hypothetical protein
VRRSARRSHSESYRHGGPIRRRRATGPVDSCFEAAADSVDDRVMRRAQARVYGAAGWKETMVQMNRHYHGQAQAEQQRQ